VGWQEDLAKIGCSAGRKIMVKKLILKKKKKGFRSRDPNISKNLIIISKLG
jgi:hypothetical protein